MNDGIDEGAVAFVAPVKITDDDTGLSLMQKCMSKGFPLVLHCLRQAINGLDIPKIVQDESKFRCYRTKDALEPYFYWQERTARDIFNFVRAADYGPIKCPTYTPTLCFGQVCVELKTKDVELLNITTSRGTAGEVLGAGDDGVLIKCAGGGILQIKSGQLVVNRGGKNSKTQTVKGMDLVNALEIEEGSILHDTPGSESRHEQDVFFAKEQEAPKRSIVPTPTTYDAPSLAFEKDEEDLIAHIEEYHNRLYPILRSISGPGSRETHKILSELLPLKTFEIPSGTQVFDWTIPPEWVCREAYIIDPAGKRICDIKDHKLHILNYSMPFRGKLSLAELQKHLSSIEEMPNAIPYITSYYSRRWGFCLSHKQRMQLVEGTYEVVIDSELKENGSLTLSEVLLPGQTDKEIFISAYTCHPQMCNDSLSGTIVAAFLYRQLAQRPIEERKYSYRFCFIPESIGAIAYLYLRGEAMKRNVIAGYVLTTIGDSGMFSYKRSRMVSSIADVAVEKYLQSYRGPVNPTGRKKGFVYDFWPCGSDERQYCSPGYNLPVGCLSRSFYSLFKEYHTSQDNMSLVTSPQLAESVAFVLGVCKTVENLDLSESLPTVPIPRTPFQQTHPLASARFVSRVPHGEPQLGPRGMYYNVGSGLKNPSKRIDGIMWILAYATGNHTLSEISAMSFRHRDQFGQHNIFSGYEFQACTVEELGIIVKELENANMIQQI